MQTRHFIFILVASMFLCSCESFFDSVTDVEIEPHESKLAVFAFLDDSNEEQSVMVGASKGYIESGDPELLSGAAVSLTKNGTEVMEFSGGITGTYFLDVPLNLETGDQLRMDISVPDYEPVYASATVTPLVDVESIVYDGEIFSLEYGETLPQYEVTINDSGATDDYYFLEVYAVNEANDDRQHIYLTTNDVNVSNWTYLGLVFDDKTFNGNTHKVNVMIDDYEGLPQGYNYQLDIKTISEDMYRHAKSRTSYWNSDGNPFAEPVTVTSNIEEDAFGIFGVIRSQTFDFPE